MNTLLTILFGAACAIAGVALVGMRRERPAAYTDSREPGGQRRDLTRRDQVQQLIDDTTLLLAHYRFRNWLIVFVFSVLGATSVLGLRANGTLAERTNKALCTFRNDLDNRATQGQAFLDDHPGGFLGIPAATLQASIDNQKKTVASLKSLDC